MKKEQTFKLIDGIFQTKEGREILQSIYFNKIKFHQKKNLSSQERFGKEDDTAVLRIPQLKNELAEILNVIQMAEDNNQHLQINSRIVITFISSHKNV